MARLVRGEDRSAAETDLDAELQLLDFRLRLATPASTRPVDISVARVTSRIEQLPASRRQHWQSKLDQLLAWHPSIGTCSDASRQQRDVIEFDDYRNRRGTAGGSPDA